MPLEITLKPGLKSQADLPQGSGGGTTFSIDDAYGPPQNQFAGPGASAPQSNTFSIDEAYHGAPNESLGGVAAQFGSGAVRGLASLPGLPADLMTLGFRGAEYLSGTKPENRAPQDQLPWAPFGSETFRTMAERNLPLAPRDNSGGPGSYAETIGEFAGPTLAAGAGILGAARGATTGTLGAIAQNPVRFAAGEAAAATAGGAGSEAARQADPNNPWLPAVGGLAGSLAPGGIAAGLRGFVRGGPAGAQRVAQALQDFERVGATPTLSQATSGSYSMGQLISRALEFTPGGYLPARSRFAQQINAAAGRLDSAVQNATRGGTSEVAAGDALRAGAARFAGKIDRTQAALEARLDAAVPAQTIVNPTETLRALQTLYEPAMKTAIGAPSAIGEAAVSATARDTLGRLISDIGTHGGTPFGSLKAFRSRLGARTGSGQSLIPDLSEGQAKFLYGAITRDMETAASANGAGNLVRLRNNYYAARKTQAENVFDARMPPQGSAESVYRSVKNSDASQLRQIMRQLSPQQRRTVAGQVLQEMGMPTPSAATGETQHFSFETFDTNFEKLNRKGSLDAFFRFSGTQDLRQALDDIAAVAERYKGSERFLRNPSGTAPVGIQVAGLTSLATPAMAGNLTGVLFNAMMAYGIPYALVRGGNSARFLRLIADTGRATEQTLPGHLARMAEFVRLNPEYGPVMKNIFQHAGQQQQQAQN